MTDWYYARGEQRIGPMSLDALLALANDGKIAASDLVWHPSLPAWTPAGEVAQLAGVAFSGAAEAHRNATSASASPNPYSAPQSVWIDPAAAAFAPMAGAEIRPGSDPIDVSACISRAFDLTKRHYLTIFIIGLVYLGCIFGSSFLLGFIEIAIKSVIAGRLDFEPTTTDQTGLFALSLALNLVSQVISLFLQLGLIRVGLNLVSDREVAVGLIFGESAKLLRAVGATILFSIAVLVGLVLLIVPGIYIALRYGQYLNAMVDKDLGVVDAFEYSSRITEENRLNLFGLSILNILIVLAGILACLIGLAFAAPVAWLASLVAYRWMQYGRDVVVDR
ncbi:DUF4339 domain-containing protein [Arenimonas sp.]|uniref:DUF4339 domain-containing protein n=1 Tax=Arenimonas sp. TaxID=1872635 RepID=UPI0039E34C98